LEKPSGSVKCKVDNSTFVMAQLNLIQLLRASQKQMETLEFIIYPDGRVQEKVTGITGASCAEVTAAIEAQLGQVLDQENTSEYFAQPLHQSISTTQITYSEW
jgi:hypothetical protein